MNAWPSLLRLLVRPGSSPTLALEDSADAEPVLELPPAAGIEPDELLALDRKVENVIRTSRERPPRRPLTDDIIET